MFFNIDINEKEPIYTQIYCKIEDMINSGLLPPHSKLPSTRELASLIRVSRSTVISAYELLESEDYIYTIKGRGTFVSERRVKLNSEWYIQWKDKISRYAFYADKLDIMKSEKIYKRGMISFKSIAPDETLFDIEELKRAFLNTISNNGEKLLNYGYARGYRPFIENLLEYMKKKGVSIENKSILITNGFTEGLDIVLSSITEEGDKIICENPTHNTAIKLMKLNKLQVVGVDINKDGINMKELHAALEQNNIKAAYLVPSYHNPTGMVMSYKKRQCVYNALKNYKVPIIEDGFNEELHSLGTHISPIAAVSGKENSVIYIGSLSKILFPGLRIGWIFADNKLIDILESVKRSRNIHTSVLDQAILHEYLVSGSLDRYVKKVRNIYKNKYEITRIMVDKYIPNKFIYGDGGLYIFIKLEVDSRELLKRCIKRGVIFTPGNIFYTDNEGHNTIRLGFARLSVEEIEQGIKVIGEEINKYKKELRENKCKKEEEN